MFPMEAQLKHEIYDLIGSRLAKHGDSFDRGIAFHTYVTKLFDDIDRVYFVKSRTDIRYEPKLKEFKPVLCHKKKD